MNTLKNYVDWKLTHADKFLEANGYPLTMQNCKTNKRMRELLIYGNSMQDGTPTPETPVDVVSVGELVTDENNTNYGKYKVPVTVRGINLFSMAKAGLTEQTINGITYTPLDDERIHIKGKLEDATKQSLYNPTFKTRIPIEAGIYNVKPNSLGLIHMFQIFGKNINSINTNVSISEDTEIFRLYLAVPAGNSREWDDIIELQVTKGAGNRTLPYEPYVNPVTTNIFLEEPLRKIGDYADYIDFKNNKVIRRTEQKIMTGRETVLALNNSATPYPYTYLNVGEYGYVMVAGPCMSNQLKHDTSISITRPGENIFNVYNAGTYNAARIIFRIYDGGVPVIAENEIKSLLAEKYAKGNPIVFYYVLSDMVEEPMYLELPKLNAKTTIIEVDTSLASSKIYGKYIKR